ncbi:CcdC protein domain-containing protein [Cohnella soli]|uniref:CcdC protein domain-containing protein n=1 Tax=Cohnella soli TaxID=425005 RepID=A0ABW0HIU9_9BACL
MNESTVYALMVAIAALILWKRTKSMFRPIKGNGTRLLFPLLFILPGLSLLFDSNVNQSEWAFGAAFGLGVAFSIPMIWTTNFEVREDNQIYAKKNWGFFVAFLGFMIVRFVLRLELSDMNPQDQMALFVTVAFGYLVPWRIVSFIKFQQLVNRSGMTR